MRKSSTLIKYSNIQRQMQPPTLPNFLTATKYKADVTWKNSGSLGATAAVQSSRDSTAELLAAEACDGGSRDPSWQIWSGKLGQKWKWG